MQLVLLPAFSIVWDDLHWLKKEVSVCCFHGSPLVQKLMFLNPMVGVVTSYRAVFLSSDLIAPDLVLVSLAIPWIVLVAGVFTFQKLQVRFADVL
mgnify:CR=1 FL=1